MESQPLLREGRGSPSLSSQRRAAAWVTLLSGLLAVLVLGVTTISSIGRVEVHRLQGFPVDFQSEVSTAAVVAAVGEAEEKPKTSQAEKHAPESDHIRVSGYAIEHGGVLKVVSDLRGEANATVLASAVYQRNVSGWNRFVGTITPLSLKDSNHKAYIRSMEALGFLEGFLTCQEMRDFYRNYYSSQFNGDDPSDDVIDFITDTYSWVSRRAEKDYMSSEYWLVIKGVLAQLEGMLHGAIEGCSTSPGHGKDLRSFDKPSLLHLLLLNNNGDLMQILPKFTPVDLSRKLLRSSRMESAKFRKDHCSALIKLLPNNADILFGHTTWDDYQCMGPRIMKSYTIPSTAGPLVRMDFSSSPGMIMSVDDFYIIKRICLPPITLIVMETSLPIVDTSLLNRIHTNTVPYWIRVRVANQLAGNGIPRSSIWLK